MSRKSFERTPGGQLLLDHLSSHPQPEFITLEIDLLQGHIGWLRGHDGLMGHRYKEPVHRHLTVEDRQHYIERIEAKIRELQDEYERAGLRGLESEL